MAKIEEIDVNFKSDVIKVQDVRFYNCLEEPFEIRGLYRPQETERFTRLPLSFAENEEVNPGVRKLMFNTAGGRVRFVTNSPYVAIAAKVDYDKQMQHITGLGEYGFDMYAADVKTRKSSMYTKSFVPNGVTEENPCFEGFFEFDDSSMREITINFPLYRGVQSLHIGLKEGCELKGAEPYSVDEPIVFYGSSITQGGCSSRPGTVYTSLVSRWLDADHINLGFSGSGKGEKALAEYIATLKMSAFVCAYGYNTTVCELKDTYYPFYKAVREKNPELTIIMMSPPVCERIKNRTQKKVHTDKREIILSVYLKALSEGDENLYFIDGFMTLGDIDAEEATVDGTHPTDLGFYNMAKAVYPILKNMLKV